MITSWLWFVLFLNSTGNPAAAYDKGALLYHNAFAATGDVKDWVMEGPGQLRFRDGWMEMYAPEEKWDHVFWCPKDFPGSFIAEWEVQNLDTSKGLVIVFFAATGSGGRDIFDPGMPKRDGTFKYYNKGEIDCYHISYYSNNPKLPDRGDSHLRKDPMNALLVTGEAGVATRSAEAHKARLIKDGAHIIMYMDDRKIIDYVDDGKGYGPAYGGGKIGFRQMRWTDFRYRNFNVWELKKPL
ncbi:MAG TPA: DUF1961 family protein [Puia sp.]|nr:DUF1961 family protein [Puia sp.]